VGALLIKMESIISLMEIKEKQNIPFIIYLNLMGVNYSESQASAF
jgi:hypothetical protein